MALVAIVALGSAGCGKVAEKATEKLAEQACQDGESGEDCEVDISEDGATVKVGDDEISAGVNTDYPAGFPDYLKVDGATPIQAVSLGDGSMSVTLQGDGVLDALRRQAESSGCTSEESATGLGAVAILSCDVGQVSLVGQDDAAGGDGQVASITVSPEG